jgi:hypothetical protein
VIVALIAVCEIAFWVLLAAGLALRYLARLPRAGAAVLLCEPLLEMVLLVVTAVDLRNGAEASWKHGLAAVYIGFTVAYGPCLVRRMDAWAAHRLAGGPAPERPPRYGAARARHEGRLWARTVAGAAVACALLQLAIWYVGDGGSTDALRSWQWTALRATGIHGLVALSYTLWPKKEPEGDPGRKPGKELAPEREGERDRAR